MIIIAVFVASMGCYAIAGNVISAAPLSLDVLSRIAVACILVPCHLRI